MLFVPDGIETVVFMLEGDDRENATLYEATPPSAFDTAIAGAMDANRMAKEAQRSGPNTGMDQIERNIRRMSENELMRRAGQIKQITNAYPDGRTITDPAQIVTYVKRLMSAQQRSLEQCLGDAAYLNRLIFRGKDVVRPGNGEGTPPPADQEEGPGGGSEDTEGRPEPIAV